MADQVLTPDDIAVIRERFHGWEQASAKTLADVFGVSVQRITAIVHSNRPDGFSPTAERGGRATSSLDAPAPARQPRG